MRERNIRLDWIVTRFDNALLPFSADYDESERLQIRNQIEEIFVEKNRNVAAMARDPKPDTRAIWTVKSFEHRFEHQDSLSNRLARLDITLIDREIECNYLNIHER